LNSVEKVSLTFSSLFALDWNYCTTLLPIAAKSIPYSPLTDLSPRKSIDLLYAVYHKPDCFAIFCAAFLRCVFCDFVLPWLVSLDLLGLAICGFAFLGKLNVNSHLKLHSRKAVEINTRNAWKQE
jgi:hypothetical protein